jgi:hypothetical protein
MINPNTQRLLVFAGELMVDEDSGSAPGVEVASDDGVSGWDLSSPPIKGAGDNSTSMSRQAQLAVGNNDTFTILTIGLLVPSAGAADSILAAFNDSSTGIAVRKFELIFSSGN